MLTITKNIKEAKLITHAGKFHPDDVFSTVLLSRIFPNCTLIRVNKVEETEEEQIVYDIGYGEFDHHGLDAKWRNEKIKYSSFGLLWSYYGKDYLKGITDNYEDVWNRIDTKLVCQIDGIDNGNFPEIKADYELLDLDKIIDLFNGNWDEESDNDDNFLEAYKTADIIFTNLLKREISDSKACQKVQEIIKNTTGDILYLDEYIPYYDALFTNDNNKRIKAVIFPAKRGGYNIKPITVSKDSFALQYIFPKEWWGLHDEELAKASNIKTATFIHVNGFIATTMTLEDAYLLASKLKRV